MTNAEYIIKTFCERDDILAELINPFGSKDFQWKILLTFEKSMGNPLNVGNVKHPENPKRNPSIWTNKRAHNPDGSIDENYGRTTKVGLLVWLSKKYNPDEWSNEE